MGSWGGEVNVCVGTICCSKAGPGRPAEEGRVETGSKVAERMERRSGSEGYWRLMVLRASRGPNTSRAWKEGKRRRAKCVGSSEGGLVSGGGAAAILRV